MQAANWATIIILNFSCKQAPLEESGGWMFDYVHLERDTKFLHY